MPHIVAELGGLAYYSWVFASFLLAQTATTVIAGKLADVYGRKPVMQVGIAVFVVGSLLGGFAGSMATMIVFRVVQGIGAGVVQPAAMTIVADLYPAAERGKIQGQLASVWAFSAVAGPLVGGFIVDDQDPRRARGHRRRRHPVARRLDRAREGPVRHRGLVRHAGPLGHEVHVHLVDTGDLGDRAFDPPHARGARHPLDRHIGDRERRRGFGGVRGEHRGLPRPRGRPHKC